MRQVTKLKVIEKTIGDFHWDSSRANIDRVIIHTMDGTASSADARFNKLIPNSNDKDAVSAHYGVLLNGDIWHWVDEDNTAYHSGSYPMNQRSIGIEHEDNGDFNGKRTDVLYTTSANLVREICTFYNIPIDRQHILKHSEIIATGCPDALDIDRIVRQAQGVEVVTTDKQYQINGAKAVRFDRMLTVLAKAGFLPNDHSENYLDNDKAVQALQSLVADRNNQSTRAGKWDQVCLMSGFTGDSNTTTPAMILARLKPTKDYKPYLDRIGGVLNNIEKEVRQAQGIINESQI